MPNCPEIGSPNDSYLIQQARDGGSYLERVPFDGAYGFYAGSQEPATVFSYAAAVAMQTRLQEPTRIVADYRDRVPEITAVATKARAS